MKFLRAAAREVIGLFVTDWVQTVVILAIVAAGWIAIGVLHITPLVVLIALVLLLFAQHIWFVLAEAGRASKARSPSPSQS
jgi:hypothetical protein